MGEREKKGWRDLAETWRKDFWPCSFSSCESFFTETMARNRNKGFVKIDDFCGLKVEEYFGG